MEPVTSHPPASWAEDFLHRIPLFEKCSPQDIGKLALTHAAPEEYGAVVAEAGARALTTGQRQTINMMERPAFYAGLKGVAA